MNEKSCLMETDVKREENKEKMVLCELGYSERMNSSVLRLILITGKHIEKKRVMTQ